MISAAVPPCVSDIASSGSHVCRHYLEHCIQCPYDGNQFYNGTGWQDHMSSKHECVPWYHSQLGVSSNLPTSFFKAATPVVTPSSATSTISDPSTTPSTDPSQATIPVHLFSKTCFFAAELASENKGTDLPPPKEGEDRLLPKKRKHQMHLYTKEHGGKIWRATDPEDDSDRSPSTV